MPESYVLLVHKNNDMWRYTITRDGVVLIQGSVKAPKDAAQILIGEIQDDELLKQVPPGSTA